jgi:hypothetical protein
VSCKQDTLMLPRQWLRAPLLNTVDCPMM